MSRKYTIEEVKKIALELGTEFCSDEYNGSHEKYTFKCVKCGKNVEKTFNDILQGHLLCLECGQKQSALTSKMTIEQAKEKAKSVGCEFLDDVYIDSKYKHRFLCAKCKKNIFKRSLNDVLRKENPRVLCKECAIASRSSKHKLTEEQFNEYKDYFHSNYYIDILSKYTEYVNSYEKNLFCHCLICNNKKYMSIQQLKDLEAEMGCGCSYISHGEKITLEFLEHNGVDYEFQKLLENGMYADFEIKLINGKVLLLEVDGRQHYVYQKFFHKSYEDFLEKQNNDRIKEQIYINGGNFVQRIKYENSHGMKDWKNDDIIGILNDILNGKFGKVQRKLLNPNYSIIDVARIHTMSKKVLVYTLDGVFYNEYNSYKECEKDLSISNLSKEHNNKRRCGDYMIRDYIENFPLQIEPYDGKNKKVKVYKNGKLIGIYDSLRAITKDLGLNRDTVSKSLKGKTTKLNKEYYFEYTLTDKAS